MNWRSFLFGIPIGLLFAIVLIFVFLDNDGSPSTASQTDSTQSDIFEDSSSPFTNLYRGNGERNFYEVNPGNEVTKIINDKESLQTQWRQIFSGTLPPPIPEVDFEDQSVVLLMSKLQDTQGYLLTINGMMIDKEIVLDYEIKEPGNGCSPLSRTTRPVHIIAIEKTDATSITLNETLLQSAPCKIQLN